MDLLPLAHSLSHAMSALSIDDNSVSVLAMLAGITGGWTLTNWLHPKPKKVKVDSKNDSSGRP